MNTSSGPFTKMSNMETSGLEVKIIICHATNGCYIPQFCEIPEDKVEITGSYVSDDGKTVELKEKIQHSLHYVAKKLAKVNDAIVYLAQKRGNSFFGEKYNMYQVVLGRMEKDEDGQDKHVIIADIWFTISDGSVHDE